MHQLSLRSEFNQILNQYKSVYGKPTGKVDSNGKKVFAYPNMPRITRSTLIFQKALTAGQTNVTFGVLTTDAPVLSTEVRLNLNDEFVITELFIGMYGTIGSATGPATGLSNKYWTYSPIQLLATNTTIMPFWDSGQLNLQVDNINYIKAWDTNQHLMIPRQQDTPLQAITTSGSANSAFIAEQKGNKDGFVQMTPTITLSGAKTNLLTLTWPNGITPISNASMVVDSGTVYFSINYAAIICRGFLAQNAAKFQGSQHA